MNLKYNCGGMLEPLPWHFGSQSCTNKDVGRGEQSLWAQLPIPLFSNKMFIFLMLPMSDIRPSDSCIGEVN